MKSNGGLFNYIPEPCQEWQLWKKCRMGINCPRSHGWLEIIYHPLLYKTKLCKSRIKQGLCSQYGVYCAKAHTRAEIRNLNEIYGVDWKRHYDLAGRVAVRSKNRCSRPELNMPKSGKMERVGLALVPKERYVIDLNLFAQYIQDKQISHLENPPMCLQQESPRTESGIQFDDLGSGDYDEKQSEGNWEIASYSPLKSSDATLDNLAFSSPMKIAANQQELGYYHMTSSIKHSRMAMSRGPSPEQDEWENTARLFALNYEAWSFNQDASFEEYQKADSYCGI